MLLAIDSSSVTASVALVRTETKDSDGFTASQTGSSGTPLRTAAYIGSSGTLVAESFINNGLTHSHTLAPLIDMTLKTAGILPEDITQIVVTNGPGSFTGLRIGVATAQGFASALGIPCAGVSSLMAAAYGALDWEGPVCAAMDARRGQIYSAMFTVDNSVLHRMTEDEAADMEFFRQKMPYPVLWVGDAAKYCAREGDHVASRPYVSGLGAARCFLNGHYRPADEIVYLRKPQAERERLERS